MSAIGRIVIVADLFGKAGQVRYCDHCEQRRDRVGGKRDSRVDLGGCPPRPPTEPDVPVKGIRLVTLWRCPSHVPSPYQDTLVRLGVLGVGLASGPQRGTPFAPQGPVGPVPPLRRYYGALRLPDSLLAALRFLRLAIPWSVCISSPFGRRRVANGSSRSLLYRLLPIRFSSGNCQDLPRSRKTRAIIRHVPPTPV